MRPYIQIRHKDQAAFPIVTNILIFTQYTISLECPASRVHPTKLLVDVFAYMYNAATTPLTLEILRHQGARRHK